MNYDSEADRDAVVAGSVEMLAVWCGAQWLWFSDIIGLDQSYSVIGELCVRTCCNTSRLSIYSRDELCSNENVLFALMDAVRCGGCLKMCAQRSAVISLKRDKISYWYSM